MSRDHDHFAQWAAAYALGALDAEDRRAFEGHLAECADCAALLTDLAPLPALIGRTDPNEIDRMPDPSRAEVIVAAARRELHMIRRRTRTWRYVAAALGAAAVALLAVLVLDMGTDEAPPATVASVISSDASTTHVTVTPKAWGTEITLDITGLPNRDGYQLWTIDSTGAWTSAATWSPTPTGIIRLTGASRSAVDDVDRIIITSADRDDLLVDTRL